MNNLCYNATSQNYNIMHKVKSKTSTEVLFKYVGKKDIDIVFLILMIEHHKGAIKMAEKLLTNHEIVENLAIKIVK